MVKQVADLLSQDPEVLGFDPVALERRYAAERDRRLRPEGTAQYERIESRLPDRLRDPYTPWVERESVDETVEVLIVGGGWGGLLAASKLAKAGIDDIRIIEIAGDFGGTWYWNRYPNAQCDTESYIYLPLLEDLGTIPSRNYVYGPELLAHAQALGRKFDLYRKTLFHTEISDARWDDRAARWQIKTDRADMIGARHIVFAHGTMTQPKLPNIPGLASYKGRIFHTARWDYGYTGGDADGGLTGLADKTVAVVGTGATAIQVVVPVAASAKRLIVFQRTPSAIGVRNNRPTDPKWVSGLTPGWQRRRSDAFAAALEGAAVDEEFPGDGWIPLMSSQITAVEQLRKAGYKFDRGEAERVRRNDDFVQMNRIRARVDEIVHDPKAAEILKPWYRPLCKRPCFHDEYLDIFNQPNVQLVDASNGGVDRLTETGIQVGDTVYNVDCIIFATGFEVGANFAVRAGFDIVGRNGARLADKWAQTCITQFGTTTAGFPNCFFMTAAQTPLPQNITTLFDELSDHITYLITETKRRDALVIEATNAGEQAWQDEMMSKNRNAARFYSECTPGYFNSEGAKEANNFLYQLYGGGTVQFFNLVRGWRANGDLAGMALSRFAANAEDDRVLIEK